jgi:heme-degrading monooxygenase HmoA
VTYVYVWRFLVRSGSEADFVAAYGPDGEWARLFRQADGFLGSELLRDRADPRLFLTVDRWVSRQAGEAFRTARAEEWEAIDRRCQALTDAEEELGSFEATR